MSRILFISDIKTNATLFEKKFAGLYYQFTRADNYHDALSIASGQDISIDLIVIDKAINCIDAIELCKIIKLKINNYIPIVIIAYEKEENLYSEVINNGGEDVFFYPFDVEILSNKIVNIIRKKELINDLATRSKNFDFNKLNYYKYPTSDKNLVLISDDQAETYFINKIIKKTYNKIYCFNSYEDLLSANLTEEVELFIVSTMFASKYGLDTCSKIINNSDFKSKPVIVIIDQDDKELLNQALQVGALDFLYSPINQDELEAKLKRILNKNIAEKNLYGTIESRINLAGKDNLTGLPNRHSLEQSLKNLFQESKDNNLDLCIMMMDIDKFKLVNDTYGHLVGDEVLVETANRISNLLTGKLMAYRFGGEEFLVVCPGVNIETANKLAEEIRQSICNQKYKISTNPYNIFSSISIGLSSIEENDIAAKEIIDRADKALYSAKESGRNKVVIYSPKD
jgi:two-component system cell cycle response regulator